MTTPFQFKGDNAELERKTLRFEIKDIQDDGTFEGYAAVYGNVDLDGDKINPGAFANFIKNNGADVPILWQHTPEEPIGVNLTLREDAKGLWVKGSLVLDVQRAKEAYALLKRKAIKGLSIGYKVVSRVFENGIRILTELELREYSVVTFPANPRAQVFSMKGRGKGVDLAFADLSRGWDANAARGRVKQWATTGDHVNWEQVKSCYLYSSLSDEEGADANFGCFKLPIADVVNGSLVIVPKAVRAAAEEVKAGKLDIPAEQIEEIKYQVNRYFLQLGESSPFGTAAPESKEANTTMDTTNQVPGFDAALERMKARRTHLGNLHDIKSTQRGLMRQIYEHKSMTPAEKKSAIEDCMNKSAKALSDWHAKNLDMGSDGYDSDYGTMSDNEEIETKGAKKKTLKVDGVELPASSFAWVGDENDTSTWKLPIDFPNDDAKTKSHLRDALAQFDRTEGIPADKKDAVLAKIKAAAKKHGIDTGKSASEIEAETKAAKESEDKKAADAVLTDTFGDMRKKLLKS